MMTERLCDARNISIYPPQCTLLPTSRICHQAMHSVHVLTDGDDSIATVITASHTESCWYISKMHTRELGHKRNVKIAFFLSS